MIGSWKSIQLHSSLKKQPPRWRNHLEGDGSGVVALDPFLGRIEVRRSYDHCGDPLLEAIQLADLHFRTLFGVSRIHPTEGNDLAEDGRAHGRGDFSDLGPTDTHAVPLGRHLIAFEVEAHQLACRMGLALIQHRSPDEVVFLGLEGHGKADARLEWVGLVAEFIAGEDQTRLDANHVQRGQAEGREAMWLPRLPDGFEYGLGVLGVAEHLVAELAGVTGPRHDHSRPVEIAEDRKSTRLNSSHVAISYAVFCLKKKKALTK